MNFLRRCPSCGKRFAVVVESKTLIDAEAGTQKIVRNATPRATSRLGGYSSPVLVVITTEEVPIETETFEIGYDCKHCGHRWKEQMTTVEKR